MWAELEVVPGMAAILVILLAGASCRRQEARVRRSEIARDVVVDQSLAALSKRPSLSSRRHADHAASRDAQETEARKAVDQSRDTYLGTPASDGRMTVQLGQSWAVNAALGGGTTSTSTTTTVPEVASALGPSTAQDTPGVGSTEGSAAVEGERTGHALRLERIASSGSYRLDNLQLADPSTRVTASGRGLAQDSAPRAEGEAPRTMPVGLHAEPEARPAQPAAEPPGVSQLVEAEWRVPDVAEAAARVNDWVIAAGGFAVATSGQHLSIKLPGASVAEFIRRFSTPVSAPAALSPALDSSSWVTVSLELLPVP